MITDEFFHPAGSHTIYFYVGQNLCGMDNTFNDGVFRLDEAFDIPMYDTALAGEPTGGTTHPTFKDEWKAAITNLSKTKPVEEHYDMNPQKFYYSQDTATLYFMQGDILCGMPQHGEGTFDMGDAFFVEEGDEFLGEEFIGGKGKTLSDVWIEAREALKKKDEQ